MLELARRQHPSFGLISQDVNRAFICRIGKRGARVFGFPSASRGPSQNFESLPVLPVATPPSAALLLQTYISLAIRVTYLLTFTSSPRYLFITLL